MPFAFLQDIGPAEIGVFLLIVLLFVGPKALPNIGRQIGSGIREFRESMSHKFSDDQEDTNPEPAKDTKPELAPPKAPVEVMFVKGQESKPEQR